MGSSDTEKQRREAAQKHKGEVVEGSGTEIGSQSLEHVVSLRLQGEVLRDLRRLAQERDTNVSALMRDAIDDFVAHGSPRTRFEWTVTTEVGTQPMGVTEWPETPASRSALRDSDIVRAS